jgi:hypothetical protein
VQRVAVYNGLGGYIKTPGDIPVYQKQFGTHGEPFNGAAHSQQGRFEDVDTLYLFDRRESDGVRGRLPGYLIIQYVPFFRRELF